MTAPLTPSDCDLRDFPRMMIDITRLRQSAFDAIIDDAAWRAGFNLWFSAWHSVPAGSLANDDASLAKAAGLGRDVRTWATIREDALRGFVACDDGRLYHETVCEFVLEAWIEKLLQRISSGAGNAKRWQIEFDPAPLENAIAETAVLLAKLSPGSKALAKARRKRPAGNPTGTDKPSHPDQQTLLLGSQGTGTGTGTENNNRCNDAGEGEAPAASPAKARKREVDPFDVTRLTDDLARRAGVPHAQPTAIGRNIDTVRQWIGDGIDLTIVEAQIDRFRIDKPDQRVSSLLFFDQGVRAQVAAQAARARGKANGTAPRPTMGEAVKPLAVKDQDSDGAREVRRWLNGDPGFAADRVAIAVEEGRLVVTVRSRFIRDQLDRRRLAEVANAVLSNDDVEVRVQ